jgi:hypothetical protein
MVEETQKEPVRVNNSPYLIIPSSRNHASMHNLPAQFDKPKHSYEPPEPKNQLYERILKTKLLKNKPNHRVEIDAPVKPRDKPNLNKSVVHGDAIIYK